MFHRSPHPQVIRLWQEPWRKEQAARWFSQKWEIPVEAYRESMDACLENPQGIPQWYLIPGPDGSLLAGAGIIENDFHHRPDLAPNLCALYVEPRVRRQGLARLLLDTACEDAALLGLPRLYLVTDHTAFYERCGWSFLTMVTGEDGHAMRMYTRATGQAGR